jgi:hypothetical protein
LFLHAFAPFWCSSGPDIRFGAIRPLPLNWAIPEDAREEALRKLLRLATPSLLQTNRAFHRLLREGVPVEVPRPDRSIAGDHVRLMVFAAELITQGKKSVTIDWTLRESARAKICVMVKCIPNNDGYPPDLQGAFVKTLLAQAERLCAAWV